MIDYENNKPLHNGRRLSDELKRHLKGLGFRVLKTKADKKYSDLDGFVCIHTEGLDCYYPEEVYKLWVGRKRGTPPGFASGIAESISVSSYASLDDIDDAIDKMKKIKLKT